MIPSLAELKKQKEAEDGIPSLAELAQKKKSISSEGEQPTLEATGTTTPEKPLAETELLAPVGGYQYSWNRAQPTERVAGSKKFDTRTVSEVKKAGEKPSLDNYMATAGKHVDEFFKEGAEGVGHGLKKMKEGAKMMGYIQPTPEDVFNITKEYPDNYFLRGFVKTLAGGGEAAFSALMHGTVPGAAITEGTKAIEALTPKIPIPFHEPINPATKAFEYLFAPVTSIVQKSTGEELKGTAADLAQVADFALLLGAPIAGKKLINKFKSGEALTAEEMNRVAKDALEGLKDPENVKKAADEAGLKPKEGDVIADQQGFKPVADVVPYADIEAVAQRLAKGEKLTEADIKLQEQYPKELQAEIDRIKPQAPVEAKVEEKIVEEPVVAEKPQEVVAKEEIKVEEKPVEPIAEEAKTTEPPTTEPVTPEEFPYKKGEEPVNKRKKIEDVYEEEDIKFANEIIDEGWFNSAGDVYERRLDLGIPIAEIKKGLKDISNGKNSAPARKIIEALQEARKKGELPMMQGTGGVMERFGIPLEEARKGIEKQRDKLTPEEETLAEKLNIPEDLKAEIDLLTPETFDAFAKQNDWVYTKEELKTIKDYLDARQKESVARGEEPIGEGAKLEEGKGAKPEAEKRAPSETTGISSEELLEKDRSYNMGEDNPEKTIGVVNYSPNFSFVTDLPAWVKKQYQRFFKKEGDLPRYVFDRHIQSKGEASALSHAMENAQKKFKQAIKEEYGGKVTAAQLIDLNKLLGGKKTAEGIPPKTAQAIENMRSHIDKLTKMMIDDGLVQGDMVAALQDNLGVYLHRSYRIHDIPNWASNVPFEVVNRATNFIRNQYEQAGKKILKEIPKIEESAVLNALKETKKSYRTEELIGTREGRLESFSKKINKLKDKYEETVLQKEKKIKKIEKKIAEGELSTQDLSDLKADLVIKERSLDAYKEKQSGMIDALKNAKDELEARDLGKEVMASKTKIDDIFARAEEKINKIKEKAEEKISISENELQGLINELLYKWDESTPVKILAGGKIGAKDLSILKKRGDIAPEIRALWGEYDDPMVNYAKSITKMSSHIANAKFLKDVAKDGMGKYFFEKPTATHFKEIAGEGSQSMNPLNGLYTTPEIKAAFEKFGKNEVLPTWMATYMKLNSWAKYAKTIASVPITHIRNFSANPFIMLRNGNLNIDKVPIAVKTTWNELANKGNKALSEYYEKLLKLGVGGEGLNIEDLKATIKDANRGMDTFDSLMDNTLTRATKNLDRGMKKAYEFEDVIYKIYNFECERAKYKEAYPEWTDAQLDAKAAEITRLNTPTYSEVPEAIQKLRQLPLVGTFVSFPYEMIRTTFNNAELALKELKDPKTRAIGAKRMAGTLAALTASTAISQYSKSVNNVSRDDDKAIRGFLPEWMRNSELAYIKNNGNGEYQILDLGNTDPHNYLKKPLIALMNGEDWKEGATEGMKEMFSPFLSEEMLFGKILDILRNKTPDDRQVYNEQDPTGKQFSDMYAHIAKALEPGALAGQKKVIKGLAGEIDPKTGEPFKWKQELVNQMTGQKVYTINIPQSFMFQTKALTDDIAEAKRIYNSAYYSKGATQAQKDEAYDRANKAIQKLIKKAAKSYQGAVQLGVNADQLQDILADSRLNNYQIAAILGEEEFELEKKH